MNPAIRQLLEKIFVLNGTVWTWLPEHSAAYEAMSGLWNLATQIKTE